MATRPALLVIVVAGAALRLWQYSADTSLWIDEIALARSLLSMNLRSLLTSPLLHNQVAPPGFLLVQKLAVTALGPSDYALRLFPLACSLASLIAFGRLAARTLEGAGAVLALTLFATAAPLIAFGSLVKPYSTDVCVAVLMWRLAHGLAYGPVTPRRAAVAALLGSLLVWFSHSGVLMTAALGAALASLSALGRAKAVPRRALLTILGCWAFSSLAVTIATLWNVTPDTRDYMQWFWGPLFPPPSLAGIVATRWPLYQLRDLFGKGQAYTGLGYYMPLTYVALTAAGFVALWRRDRRTALLLTAPAALTLAAAAARQYPFADRLIFFLLPGFMLAIAAAAEAARRLLWPFSRVAGTLAAAGLLFPAVYPLVTTPPAYYTEHMKPVMAYVRDRRRPGDAIYVYYGAAPAVTFYGPRYGLGRAEYLIGGCHRGDGRRYLRELDTLRGRPRVWVLLTHAGPRFREREDILAYLDAVGTRLDGIVVESHGVAANLLPAEAHLYDLSGDRTSSAAAAEAFPLKGPSSPGARLGCGEGPQAMLETDFQ
ncbi:MAG TPA: hypothetical protein VF668_00585 [Pyrinomonadaceae bacterium]